MNSAVLLRKRGGKLVALLRNGYHRFTAPAIAAPSLLATLGAFLAVVAVPLLMLVITLVALHFGADSHGVVLADVAVAALPKHLKEKKANLDKLIGELETGQKEMQAGPLTQARGEELEGKAKEAESIQAELKRYELVTGAARLGRQVDDPLLPTDGEEKSDADVVGYRTVGEAFVNSPEFKQFRESGMPQGNSAPMQIKDIHSGRIPVTRREVLEGKAVATIGANVVRPSRDGDFVRTTEQDRLTIRDVVNVGQTDSSSVEYVVLTSTTRAAAPVAESALKPEGTLALGTATAPVRTIAVWMPVTEQQLQDVPQLRGIIDNELNYDLDKVEEEQIVWGTGVGQNLLGIMNSGISAARAVGGDTIIDSIRRMITDIAVAGGAANAVLIDPLDMETVVLNKATTNQYIWVVAPGADGAQRIWSLRPVETVAMRQPATLGGGPTTLARRVLVGDFLRGATLWDRQQSNIAVGYINDQFIRNQRTIRAEERVAFGVKRPLFFRYLQTQANVV